MQKQAFAVRDAAAPSQELFAIDVYLWSLLCTCLRRCLPRRRSLRQLVVATLLLGLLCQMALPLTAMAAHARVTQRARAEAAQRRDLRANEKAAPSPAPVAPLTGLAQTGLVLTQINTPFNGLTGLAYHAAQHQLLAAVNAPNGQPRNLALIGANGAQTAYANVSNLGGELRLAAARDDGNGKSLAGFNRGELFFSTLAVGVIARLSANAATLQNPWITLAGETGRVTGLTLDRTNVFAGHVIAVTATGRIYRVNANAQATLVAHLNTPLSGVAVLPNDVAK